MELEELLFTESELFVPEGESVVLVPIPAMLLRADIEVPKGLVIQAYREAFGRGGSPTLRYLANGFANVLNLGGGNGIDFIPGQVGSEHISVPYNYCSKIPWEKVGLIGPPGKEGFLFGYRQNNVDSHSQAVGYLNWGRAYINLALESAFEQLGGQVKVEDKRLLLPDMIY